MEGQGQAFRDDGGGEDVGDSVKGDIEVAALASLPETSVACISIGIVAWEQELCWKALLFVVDSATIVTPFASHAIQANRVPALDFIFPALQETPSRLRRRVS